MKYSYIFFAVLLIVGSAVNGYAQKRKPADFCPRGVTQADLNDCAAAEFRKADAELNSVYQRLLAANKDDQNFIDKLKAAQRAWLSFRDAQIETLYPAPDPQSKYGSVFPMCYSLAKAELTAERTKHLQRMLKGREGDVCNWDVH